MNLPANCDTQGPSKFKRDTLTTLKLVRKYNPGFVTTFIVSYKEAHCLTGADLRRCENMITLKKKKEINAKYSGLLKSTIKVTSDSKNKKKSSARGERPKTQGLTNAQSKNEKVVKGEDSGKSGKDHLDCKKKKSEMKEIFKSNVYSNFSTTSILDDSVKYSNGKIMLKVGIRFDVVYKSISTTLLDHLPTPRDIIEKTGSKIKSFWNLQKSTKTENSLRPSCSSWTRQNNK